MTKISGGLYDCHTHTHFSHDSVCPQEEMCEAALKKGLLGVAITDHCDIEYGEDHDVLTPIFRSVEGAAALKEKYRGRLQVMRGVEIGEGIFFPEVTARLITMQQYDVILGSVHAARYPGFERPYSGIDFSHFTSEEIYGYLKQYFADMREMVETCDFDVLCHMTCPIRYVVQKFGFQVDLIPFREEIEGILKRVIDKDLAFEINTSCCDESTWFLLPDLSIVERYYELGGRKITLASDAHVSARVGMGFDTLVQKLKTIGFTHACYFENRTAKPYTL